MMKLTPTIGVILRKITNPRTERANTILYEGVNPVGLDKKVNTNPMIKNQL